MASDVDSLIAENARLRAELEGMRRLGHVGPSMGEPIASAVHAIPRTVRIVSDETPLGYVIINESDFDPTIHTLSESEPTPEA